MPRSSSNRVPDRRQRAERAGRSAENLAAWFLRLKGFRIVATRYKTPIGEIDIVARRGKLIAIVEVKHRAGSAAAHAQALESVNTSRIIGATQWFISAHPRYQGFDFRFDVISVASRRWPHHLVNAFSA